MGGTSLFGDNDSQKTIKQFPLQLVKLEKKHCTKKIKGDENANNFG